jgi:hypothetical protein
MKLISYKDAEVVSACLRRVSNESVRSFDAAIDGHRHLALPKLGQAELDLALTQR